MLEWPRLVCPACTTVLEGQGGWLGCSACARRYPVVAGIPDLRLRSDRYLDLEADRAKACRLAARDDLPFPDLVREYWRMTPEVPAMLADRYAANVIEGVGRADVHLDELAFPLSGAQLLDVGCGTGGLLVAAARRGAIPTGVDIALRWLVVAARQLRDEGVEACLVAADGAALPFAGGSFDIATCVETLEHAEDQSGLARGFLGAVRPGGQAYLVTSNRCSIAPEPAVRLWGVGFLPRRWAPRYVALRRGTGYRFVRPVSLPALRHLIGNPTTSVKPGPLPPPPRHSSRLRLLACGPYERVRATSLGSAVLTPVAPFLAARVTGSAHVEDSTSTRAEHAPRTLQPASSTAPAQGVSRKIVPDLSVVIPSVNGWDDLGTCLEALAGTDGDVALEVIVVDRLGSRIRDEVRQHFAGVVLLEAAREATIPELRALGFEAARADVVGVIEDHVIVPPDWASRMLAAHAAGAEVVGGAVENAARDRLVERAAFLCEYHQSLCPGAGSAGPIPGNNVTYRRRLLEQFRDTIREGRWEDHLHEAMRTAGVRMECRPDIRVGHKKHFTWSEYVSQRFLYSRAYAGLRLRGAPAHRRALYGLGSAALPPLLMARIVRQARRAEAAPARDLVPSLPLLGLFVVSWAAGEMAGAWLGVGGSLRKVC